MRLDAEEENGEDGETVDAIGPVDGGDATVVDVTSDDGASSIDALSADDDSTTDE